MLFRRMLFAEQRWLERGSKWREDNTNVDTSSNRTKSERQKPSLFSVYLQIPQISGCHAMITLIAIKRTVIRAVVSTPTTIIIILGAMITAKIIAIPSGCLISRLFSSFRSWILMSSPLILLLQQLERVKMKGIIMILPWQSLLSCFTSKWQNERAKNGIEALRFQVSLLWSSW